jgi:DNA-binding XRE family transcriptional regulator
MNELETENNGFVQFSAQLKKLGTELCTIRKEIGHSQSDIAEWIKCDRRKVAEIEAGGSYDFKLIFEYANKLSVEIKLCFTVL